MAGSASTLVAASASTPPERRILDAFRMRHLVGSDLAIEALEAWSRRGGQPAELLDLARSFPRTQTVLRVTLAILL